MDPILVKNKIAELAKIHGRLVFNTAYRVIGDIQRAEDITQDIFIKLFSNRALLEGNVRNWAAYLTTLTTRTSLDLLRKLKVRHEDNNRQAYEPTEAIDTTLNPEQQFSLNQDIEVFRHHLSELSSQEAQVIILRFLHEFTYQEIAEQLEISSSLVGVTLKRGIEKINLKVANPQLAGA
ncbi:sigma-70 family RNA polymerase sigma factor [Aliikangiella marina]|uniref:Sigma-70 family RNA polymerase sigma factor n=1 Tax=Aliikangiella marina TaxID=1712262 RepID=A0A545T1F5_9GAMM|nr:sigma-70 family RNA polymerase sigma factor [Aliikangiella marina]TQV71057.1 sigma-70 family RNA polymerase sigma factor [Aliikangiella marina]